jgi:hypothetical protein
MLLNKSLLKRAMAYLAISQASLPSQNWIESSSNLRQEEIIVSSIAGASSNSKYCLF